MKRIIFMTILFCLSVGNVAGQKKMLPTLGAGRIEYGELIFSVNNGGNAITKSTASDDELPIDHVGIIVFECDSPYVLEATPEYGVKIASMKDFMSVNPVCVVGKVRGVDAHASVERALKFFGLPYDSLFDASDSAIYCSELVQKSYVDTLGNAIFSTIPMSFHDNAGVILPYWTDFYGRHGKKVPEGEPGTNPAQLARSQRVVLVGWLLK